MRPEDVLKLEELIAELGSSGQRVMAFAKCELPDAPAADYSKV